ncbi:SDR family oxidoreductase [Leptospira idonii]|uniref:SDR family oxidoreductase n=1 Tax=Leptospira idonii TaxID=1193500 RepID=A0A4V3JXW1_9LEPT|nr:SDR family oxidoreductase [Leptospira idonii]TGN18946.1 SDR family oxidoreductase [Leptospira idonii]
MSSEKKIAFVTGASRGIGLAISQKLVSMGHYVLGVSRTPETCSWKHDSFELLSLDLRDTKQIQGFLKERKETFKNLNVVVHNAGVGYFSPLEELSWQQIQDMISLHLTAPMLITNSLLRDLKSNRGRVFLIGSIAGTKVSPWGNVYGATKAGLIHFGKEMFQELRKSGVRVTNIIPDLTRSEFYNELSFTTEEDSKAYLLPECIASALETVMLQREGTVVSEILIQPELFKIKKKEK